MFPELLMPRHPIDKSIESMMVLINNMGMESFMHDNLDSELCAKYPMLYKDRQGQPSKTSMCWGFKCNDGWYKIIDELSANLTSYAESINIDLTATVVKEKFGALTFGVDFIDEIISGFIQAAYVQTRITCEMCGETGSRKQKYGWVKIVCPKCAKELGYV